MPYSRPTIEQIRKRVLSDFKYELKSNGVEIPGTVERALADAVAGASHGFHGRLAWVAINAFAQSAEDAEMIKMAAFFGVFRREAVRATGLVYFFRPNVAGQSIPKGLHLKVADVEIEVTETTPFPDGEFKVAVPCRAVDGGQAGNLAGATQLSVMDSVVGVNSFALVKDPEGLAGGTDAETNLELRTRLLERLRNPPSGGGPGSYIAWAKEVEGVTRVWEYGKIDENGDLKLGHVTVLFMRDGDESAFPSAPEIAAVNAKILEYAPLHLAGLHVGSPIDKPLLLTIELTPDTTELRALVVASIQKMLATKAVPPRQDGTTFFRSDITDAIGDVKADAGSNSGGVALADYKLTSPAADLTLDQFELLTMSDPGSQITWV